MQRSADLIFSFYGRGNKVEGDDHTLRSSPEGVNSYKVRVIFGTEVSLTEVVQVTLLNSTQAHTHRCEPRRGGPGSRPFCGANLGSERLAPHHR